MRGRRALLLLLVIACWRLGPSAAQPKPGAGGKKLLLPDVAPTLLDIQAKGSANPGARPLAELNDRHSTTRQKTKKKSFPMAGVTQVGTSPHGSTVQLTAHLDAKKANVYALAGATGANVDGHDRVMRFPAAFQVATPFGTDIGGVAPAFFAVNPDCQYDSWLTVGVTDGSAAGGLATSPGLGLDKWTADAAFRTTDGAVFWMDPNKGPSERTVVLAQITTTATGGSAQATLQGRSAKGVEDWSEVLMWDW